jgi:hypothetical protein
MAIILGGSLILWAIAFYRFKPGGETFAVIAIPLAGISVCALYQTFMIRCPWCRRNLGHLTRSLTHFSLFRFPKGARFCPYCMIDFQDDVKKRP